MTDDAWSFVLDIAGARHAMADAHMDTGKHQEGLCNFQGAAASYLQATRLQPENAETWTHLGLVYNTLEMFGHAEGCLRYALALNPHQVRAALGLATTALNNKQPDEADKHVARAQAITGETPDILLAKGNIAHYREDFVKSEGYYRAVLSVVPNSGPAHSSLGNALIEQGRHEEARGEYAEAHKLSPNDARLEMNLAMLELLTGDYENGWRHWESRLRAMTVR